MGPVGEVVPLSPPAKLRRWEPRFQDSQVRCKRKSVGRSWSLNCSRSYPFSPESQIEVSRVILHKTDQPDGEDGARDSLGRAPLEALPTLALQIYGKAHLPKANPYSQVLICRRFWFLRRRNRLRLPRVEGEHIEIAVAVRYLDRLGLLADAGGSIPNGIGGL